MLTRHTLHDCHHQHIMVNCKISLFKDWSQLKLVGCNLIMACFARNSKFESLNLDIFHKLLHTCRDGAKVVVIHLLVLGRVVSHQRTPRHHKVWSCSKERLIHKEVFLFPTQIGNDLLRVWIEILSHSRCCLINRMKRLLQWHFVVESLTRIRDENGGNHQCIANDEYWRCGIPCRIASCLESRADSSRWKRTGVWFLLYEKFPFKLFHHSTLSIMFHKTIMFLSRTFGKRLKPMGVVSHTILYGPSFDALCHLVSNGTVKRCPIVYHIAHFLIHLRWQIFTHLLPIEDVFAEIFTGAFLRLLHIHRSTLECLVHHLKS